MCAFHFDSNPNLHQMHARWAVKNERIIWNDEISCDLSTACESNYEMKMLFILIRPEIIRFLDKFSGYASRLHRFSCNFYLKIGFVSQRVSLNSEISSLKVCQFTSFQNVQCNLSESKCKQVKICHIIRNWMRFKQAASPQHRFHVHNANEHNQTVSQ